jgi:hypothetical protein
MQEDFMANSNSSVPKVDLNHANIETLMTLPGIGWELAERIIEFREAVKTFDSPIEIIGVKGISARMYHQFSDRVTVTSLPEESEPVEDDETKIEMPKSDQKPEDVFVSDEAVAPTPAVETTTDDDHNANGYIIVPDESDTAIATESDLEPGYVVSGGDDEPKEEEGSARRSWLLMVVGALLGTFLTLTLLYLANDGTLIVANNPIINRQFDEVRQREANLTREINDLKDQLNAFSALDTRLRSAESEVRVLQREQDSLGEQILAVQEQAATLDEQVIALQEQNSRIEETITEIQMDTGRFNEFLTGLRDLLTAVQELPVEPAAEDTPAPTATPTVAR